MNLPPTRPPLPAFRSSPHGGATAGVWAIAGDALRVHLELARMTKPALGTTPANGLPSSPKLTRRVVDGVANVELRGVMLKYGGFFSAGPTTLELQWHVEDLTRDPGVKAIMLVVDSPGGAMEGAGNLADAVAAAVDARKPVTAYIEDIGTAAAYYVASQASRVVAGRSAFVGGVGTYTVLYDSSKAAENAGVKVHVVRAGAFKGMTTDGTKITPDTLTETQRVINAINARFTGAVSRGRHLAGSRLDAVTDGRMHIASDALKLGLIDAVQTYDEALAELRRGISGQQAPDARPTPATSAPAPGRTRGHGPAASWQQLRAVLPDSSAAFREECVERGLSVAEAVSLVNERARDREMDLLRARLEATEEAIARANDADSTPRSF